MKTPLILGLLVITACTKQQAITGVNTVTKVTVGVCQEAPQLIPAGQEQILVGLICEGIDTAAPSVAVLIDKVIWDLAKKTQRGERL